MTLDLRTLIYLLNLELCEQCSRTLGWNIQLGLQADACNRGAAVEVDAIGEQQLHAAEVDAIGSSS